MFTSLSSVITSTIFEKTASAFEPKLFMIIVVLLSCKTIVLMFFNISLDKSESILYDVDKFCSLSINVNMKRLLGIITVILLQKSL